MLLETTSLGMVQQDMILVDGLAFLLLFTCKACDLLIRFEPVGVRRLLRLQRTDLENQPARPNFFSVPCSCARPSLPLASQRYMWLYGNIKVLRLKKIFAAGGFPENNMPFQLTKFRHELTPFSQSHEVGHSNRVPSSR